MFKWRYIFFTLFLVLTTLFFYTYFDVSMSSLSVILSKFLSFFHMRQMNCFMFDWSSENFIYSGFFQTRQPIFAQLLGATFRVSQCSWLTLDQRLNVENCIRTLSEVAKSRDIPISPDLDIQVSILSYLFKANLSQLFQLSFKYI